MSNPVFSGSMMNESDLFAAAIEITGPSERTRYLDEACKDDPELRRRVERLLKQAAKDDSFMESDPTSNDRTSILTIKVGSQLGPYKLKEKIGEGGMGVVFVAEQKQPVRRRVALKVIKPGMDSKQVLARFEAERDALALMDHPSIARVLDAGTTEHGLPYFVMELVNGVPINRYCDENQLTIKERLQLFCLVCQGVQHAHQKGIIHRDLKPSNILITQYDGRPAPKVIDFGVAKATGKSLTDHSVYTQLGQIVGTLEYMSPEQAQRNQMDIDTRSDIYSLGVVLYELLTGELPFEKKRLREAALDELLRIIREEDPPSPSTRVSTSESRAEIASNRKIEPSRLGPIFRGELDWIVMKTMDKERDRRYETANGLASDIQRYLNGELVMARPPSRRYRVMKFAQRNQSLLLATTIIGILLIGGTTISAWQALRAIQAERKAERLLNQSLADAKEDRAARERIEDLLKKNSELSEQAQEAVDQYVETVQNDALLQSPNASSLRRQLLASARAYYAAQVEYLENADSKLQLVNALLKMNVLLYESERLEESTQVLEKALQILEKHEFASASPVLIAELKARVYNDLAVNCNQLGDAEKCRDFSRLALEEIEQARHSGLGGAKLDSCLITALINFAKFESDSSTKIDVLHQAKRLAEKIVNTDPENTEIRKRLIEINTMFSEAHLTTNLKGAEQAVLDAEKLARQMVQEDPDSSEHLHDLSRVLVAHARVCEFKRQADQLLELETEAAEMAARASQLRPHDWRYRSQHAFLQKVVGDRHAYLGDFESALKHFEKATQVFESLRLQDEDNVSVLRNLAEATTRVGSMYAAKGDKETAWQRFQNAIEFQKTIINLAPERTEYRNDAALSLVFAAMVARDNDKIENATKALEDALQILNESGVDRGDDLNSLFLLARVNSLLADIAMCRVEPDVALQSYTRAMVHWRVFQQSGSPMESNNIVILMARTCSGLLSCLLQMNLREQAIDEANRMLSDFPFGCTRAVVAVAFHQLGDRMKRDSRPEESTGEFYERAEKIALSVIDGLATMEPGPRFQAVVHELSLVRFPKNVADGVKFKTREKLASIASTPYIEELRSLVALRAGDAEESIRILNENDEAWNSIFENSIRTIAHMELGQKDQAMISYAEAKTEFEGKSFIGRDTRLLFEEARSKVEE